MNNESSLKMRNDEEKEIKIKNIENAIIKGSKVAFFATLTVMVMLCTIRIMDAVTS